MIINPQTPKEPLERHTADRDERFIAVLVDKVGLLGDSHEDVSLEDNLEEAIELKDEMRMREMNRTNSRETRSSNIQGQIRGVTCSKCSL